VSKPNPSLQIAKDLAAKASPPFYVLNGDAIRSTTEDFRDSFARIFPHGLSLHYSFKTNSDPRVLKTLREAGMGAEVSTGQELALALQLGFRAQDVLFDGPGKTGQEIPLLLDQQVALHVDSLDELYFVLDMARVQRRKPRIGLRLAASKNGHLSRFGLDPSEVGPDNLAVSCDG
jgi:diaminopimelate decarboxylase